MLVMVRAALPVLVSVTPWDPLVVLIVWLANAKLAGAKDTTGAGAEAPVPLRLIACGFPAALSTMLIEPV